jgi:hypothetical protein
MTSSGRLRHRDRDTRKRLFEDEPAPPPSARAFRMSGEQREHVAECLREIDDARRTLEAQHRAENRDVIRVLRAAANEVYELLNDLEEVSAPE